ncbi:hypothetical protein TYRP_023175 [Tyrophagus putrescentiae]|nr:hypothetical protein TYRP_023175 [Tyrophagus putrescentiae]
MNTPPKKPSSSSSSFLDALFRRELGLLTHKHKHFLESLTALCVDRLPLRLPLVGRNGDQTLNALELKTSPYLNQTSTEKGKAENRQEEENQRKLNVVLSFGGLVRLESGQILLDEFTRTEEEWKR